MHCSPSGKSPITMIAITLLLIGAINWGLIGLGHFVNQNLNLVDLLLGRWPTVEAIVYILVGLAAVYKIAMCKGACGSGCGCDCGPEKQHHHA